MTPQNMRGLYEGVLFVAQCYQFSFDLDATQRPLVYGPDGFLDSKKGGDRCLWAILG